MQRFRYIDKIPQELMDEIQEELEKAWELASISVIDTPAQAVRKIHDYVELYLQEDEQDRNKILDTAITLACAWADAVIKEHGWHWMYLGDTLENADVYLVSPKENYCCPPLYFVNKIMQGKNIGLDGYNDNTIILLFNMLKDLDDKTPEQQYTVVS